MASIDQNRRHQTMTTGTDSTGANPTYRKDTQGLVTLRYEWNFGRPKHRFDHRQQRHIGGLENANEIHLVLRLVLWYIGNQFDTAVRTDSNILSILSPT